MMNKSSLQLLDDLIIELESLNSELLVISTNVSLPSNTTATIDDDVKALPVVVDTTSSSLSETGGNSTADSSVRQKQPKVSTDIKSVTTKQKPSKSKNESTTNNNNEDNEPLSINSIDLRVGIIRTVKRHDTAEKLYVEEIDVGEETYRPIASGLVPYYTLEQMQGRRLIVVCNLKPRNLVGFKSHGMVLCASKETEDGRTIVEFVDPPINSQPGDRITGELLVGQPYSMSKCDKSKAFDTIAPDLKVDDHGVAYWKTHRLVCGMKSDGGNEDIVYESCTTPTLRDAHIH